MSPAPVGIPLKRKAEEAFAALIQAGIVGADHPLHDIPVIPGHRGETRSLPVVVCYAAQAWERDELADTGIYDVELKFFILTQADEESIEDQDARLQAVQDILRNTDVLATLNRPADPEPDTRAIKEFHVWGFYESGQDEGRENRHYGDVLTYTVVCQGIDA